MTKFDIEGASREFMERLRVTNPRMAEKYEHYKEAKDALGTTSTYAFREVRYKETLSSARQALEEGLEVYRFNHDTRDLINESAADSITRLWMAYKSKSRRRGDVPDLKILGVESVGDLIRLVLPIVIEQHRAFEKKEYDKERVSYPEFLEQKLKERSVYVKDAKSAFRPMSRALWKETMDCGDLDALELDEHYYFTQYERLEGDRVLHTEDAEHVFYPILEKIFTEPVYLDGIVEDAKLI